MIFIFSQVKSCFEAETVEEINWGQVETRTYTPPVIDLPFLSPEPPVPIKNLPIKIEDVKQTIRIDLPKERDIDTVELVVSQSDKIYTTTNMPQDLKVTVTELKKSPLSLKAHYGYSLIRSGKITFHSFSIDPIGFKNFWLGLDFGTNVNFNQYLVGVSLKYNFADLQIVVFEDIQPLELCLVLGKDLFRKNFYFGLTFDGKEKNYR